MGALQRIIVALGLAGLAAVGIRLGGGATVPTQRGGWSRLPLPPDEQELLAS